MLRFILSFRLVSICYDCMHCIFVIPGSPNFLPNIFQVKIVIVDSVTFHFRQDFEDLALRTRLLGGMALKLMNLAKKYNLAVSISFCS